MNIGLTPSRSTKILTSDGFRIGDKVLCIDDTKISPNISNPVVKGRIYCVRGVRVCELCNGKGLYLVGNVQKTPSNVICSICEKPIAPVEKAWKLHRFVLASRQEPC